MGFFEWAVLFLLCEILLRVDRNDPDSEIPLFSVLTMAIFFVSFVMVIASGVFELVEWFKQIPWSSSSS